MHTFEDIVGYKGIKDHIKHSIRLGKLSHAYILDGPKGSGKKMIANAMAKTLQCEEKGEEPCNRCMSCVTFDSANHPDVIYVEPRKRKTIGIEDIRQQIGETIDIKPYKYDHKIYIIDQAELLTEQAQNGLLKTIEEPPEYAVILLLSNNMSTFLPTILSRCVVLTLRPLQREIIKNYLIQHEGVDEGSAELFAAFSHGAIGVAKDIAVSEEFGNMRDQVLSLLEGLRSYNKVETMEGHKTLEPYKDQINKVLDLMIMWYRDLLMIKEGLPREFIMNQDKYSQLESFSSHLTINKITQNLDTINETKARLRRNANYQLTMEMLLLRLK